MKFEASDLHLKVGSPPVIRVTGELRRLNRGPIDDDEMARLVLPLFQHDARPQADLRGKRRRRLRLRSQDRRQALAVPRQRAAADGQPGPGGPTGEQWIPDFKSLYLPDGLEKLCQFSQGMILLAGITGSGKSTTIASMLDWVNHNYRKHILTLEDPIEFTFTEDKCLINQREIGIDVKDFKIGMKHAVREDPDVMLVGEMRDRETFETAIQAAETGHLVFGTIHASTAPSTIGRILDLFPEGQRSAVRSAMAFNMKAILAQKLLPSIKPGVKPRADGRDHDLQPHGPETDSGRAWTRNWATPSAWARRKACRTSR